MSTNIASFDTGGDALLVVVLATGLLLVDAPGLLQGLWLLALVVGWVWWQRHPAPVAEQIPS